MPPPKGISGAPKGDLTQGELEKSQAANELHELKKETELLGMALGDCQKRLDDSIPPTSKYVKYLSYMMDGNAGEHGFGDRVWMQFENQWDTEIEIWGPVWNSKDVHIRLPVDCLRLGDEKPAPCVRVPSSQKFGLQVYFSSPPDKGIAIRLSRAETGSLMFPIKIEGKLKCEKVDI